MCRVGGVNCVVSTPRKEEGASLMREGVSQEVLFVLVSVEVVTVPWCSVPLPWLWLSLKRNSIAQGPE